MTTQDKLAKLREVMQQNQVDAFIVYSADPHMSEYLPKEWQERKWISGFTGSENGSWRLDGRSLFCSSCCGVERFFSNLDERRS